ncbi:hypothetical protein EDB89DRAFT_2073150 [Lactarius sanguifluus]|nr:hypothetical protein EDB89DRAFT_2073150 [Lactarius sanguifluus]
MSKGLLPSLYQVSTNLLPNNCDIYDIYSLYHHYRNFWGGPGFADKPDGFLRSQFILPVAKTYLGFASRSVLRPTLGAKSPPRGLYVMILTAVERAMRAHLTGRFNAPGDFNHQTSWNAMKDFDRILDRVSESRWAQALDFVDCDKDNLDESMLSAYRVDLYLSSSPAKPGQPVFRFPLFHPFLIARSLAPSIHPPSFLPRLSFSFSPFLATTQTDDDDADDPQDGL